MKYSEFKETANDIISSSDEKFEEWQVEALTELFEHFVDKDILAKYLGKYYSIDVEEDLLLENEIETIYKLAEIAC